MNSSYLNNTFYLGGYYIVKSFSTKDWMKNKGINQVSLSASRCLCEFYPDIEVLWSESRSKKEIYKKNLKLDNYIYEEMESWINKEFEKKFDYPDVFNDYESALEFYNKFLTSQKDLKIIGIGLPKEYKNIFLEDEYDLRNGIYKNLIKDSQINSKGTVLGYEILGYEFGGFHSYICNGLQEYYYDKFKFKLNDNGFISTLEEAQILAEYTNEEIDGTEPVTWLPWIILEYET